ncbi:MAG TPA: phosphopantetheine-binding protein [Aequorivita sp.]|nr:phosphopantetheine-binding protein [Aequorivita sp.]
MTSEEIFAKLEPIVRTYLPDDVEIEEINPKSDLTQQLNINSAHLVDIVLDIEDAFDLEFKNEDMESMRNIEDTIKIIQSKLANN